MRIMQLKYLLDIRDNHSISKTAENYYISPQALSKSLKALEKEMQCQLYEYKQKKIFLTAAGLLVCDYAEQICALSDALSLDLRRQYKSPESTFTNVTILSFTALSNLFMHTAYTYFQQHSPSANITIHNIDSLAFSAVVDEIRTTDADLIFLTLRTIHLQDFLSSLKNDIHSYECLLDDELIVVSRNNHLTTDTLSSITELSPSSIFSFSFSHLDSVPYNISANVELLKNLLSTQKVAAHIPKFIAKHYFSSGQFKLIPRPEIDPAVHLCLYKKEPSTKLKQYIQLVKGYLADLK